MPGCSVFKRVMEGRREDARFSKEDAHEAYGDFVGGLKDKGRRESEVAQNRKWYALYREHCETNPVAVLNSDYLFCRDASALAMAVFVACMVTNAVCAVFLGSAPISRTSALLVGLLAILSWMSAHLKAARLSTTVIAVDIVSKEKEGERA